MLTSHETSTGPEDRVYSVWSTRFHMIDSASMQLQLQLQLQLPWYSYTAVAWHRMVGSAHATVTQGCAE